MGLSSVKTAVCAISALLLMACEPAKESQLSPAAGLTPELQGYQKYLSDLEQKHLLPGYALLSEKAQALSEALTLSCQGGEPGDESTRKAWKELMSAWQNVKWMRLGPVAEQSRHQRLQYWPDGNDAVGRGLQKLLLVKPAPSLERLAQINVGAQGLPALEQLLFSPLSELEVDVAHKCAVAGAISANIKNITADIKLQWPDFSQQLVAGQGEFNGLKDAVEELLSNGLAELIIVLDNRLTYPLSLASPGIPALAESPFADASMYNIRQNLQALKQLYTGGGGYGLDDILVQQNQAELAQQLLSELDKSIAMANALPDSFTTAMAEPQSWQKMQQLLQQLRTVQKLLVEGMLAQLQLNIGFNALDGD